MRPNKCKALGIRVVNPGPGCPWATEACSRACYAHNAVRRWRNARNRVNGRLYMQEAIARDKAQWSLWTPEDFRGLGAVRLASRYEAFKGLGDIDLIEGWMRGAPDTLFWVPTRAWRNREMRNQIEARIKILPNARVQASIDRDTTASEYRMLRDWGWSTMGFWTRRDLPHPFLFEGARVLRCPKTWEGAHGDTACKACADNHRGCFAPGRVDIHLRLHS